jgi:hypothetical protein
VAAFLTKWANVKPAQPTTPQRDPRDGVAQTIPDSPAAYSPAGEHEQREAASELANTTTPPSWAGTEHACGIPWAEWKALVLNRLFQDQGITGEPGRITAATVRHGERKACHA